jgi:hypothetical protein
MTVSSCDESISKNVPNNSLVHTSSDAVPMRDYLMANVAVTYAPPTIWKDSHWICKVTTFAPRLQQRFR